MIPKEKIDEFRQALESSEKPIFFFDDDPDGLCSFLLLYRLIDRGKGVIVKQTPLLDNSFLRRIDEYGPDKVFILDIPQVNQDFLDEIAARNLKTYWLDHHPPQLHKNVNYYNPRTYGKENLPTSYWAYKVARRDEWIAMVGTVADWHLLDDVKHDFRAKYPKLLDEDVVKVEEAYFNSKLGKLAKIFSFNLKGLSSDVTKAIKVLTRIENPYEILQGKSARGRLVLKRYQRLNKQYEEMLDSIEGTKEKILLFKYQDGKTSFTSDLSNELLYKYPGKIIIIAREHAGEMKCSIRSPDIVLPKILEKALKGVEGYGGGHEHAVGCCIKKKDFDKFLGAFTKQI